MHDVFFSKWYDKKSYVFMFFVFLVMLNFPASKISNSYSLTQPRTCGLRNAENQNKKRINVEGGLALVGAWCTIPTSNFLILAQLMTDAI
jgi:hypothetical protein